MKKKIILGLGICLIALSLFGCNNQKQNSNTEEINKIEESIEENILNKEGIETEESIVSLQEVEITEGEIIPIPKEDINNEEYIFYACLSIYMEDFDRNYNLAGQAIDDNDLNDFHYYLDKLQMVIKNIENLNTPLLMEDAKIQIINSLKSYKNAAIKLSTAYGEADYLSYGEFFKEISNAEEFAANFFIYCENFDKYVPYLSSFMETSFYMRNYNLYSMSNAFTDEENKILYTLNRNIVLIPNIIDNSFINYINGESPDLEINKIETMITLFEELEISNENLNKFRNELVESLKNFVNYLNLYFSSLAEDCLDVQFEETSKIRENAHKLYDAMVYMKDFYNERGLTIDFSPTSDYITIESSFDVEVDDNNELEIIKEEHTIVE